MLRAGIDGEEFARIRCPGSRPVRHRQSRSSRSIRAQVGKAHKSPPTGGGLGSTSVETRIEDQCLSRRIAYRQEVADGMTTKKRLRKAPNLTRKRELANDMMRNRERLTELRSMYRPLGLLIEKHVRIVMKPLTSALASTKRISRTPEIKFWHATIVSPPKIARCDRRFALSPRLTATCAPRKTPPVPFELVPSEVW